MSNYKDMEKKKATDRRYYLTHKEERKKYLSMSKEKRQPIVNAGHRRQHHKRRKEIMEFLGGIYCSQCGLSDYRILQLDHKDGKGFLDKKRFKGSHSRQAYYWKHPQEAKQKLQVLCANCHAIKSWDNKEYQIDEKR